MKVEFSPGAGFYSNKKTAEACKDPKSIPSGKTDVAEFSRGTGAVPDKTLLRVKAAIQDKVGASAADARLESLRQSIKDGVYEVSSHDIAGAILGYE